MTLKNTLYSIALLLLLSSSYFGYDWYISEPENKEPLPALFSFFSSLILLIIGWINDQKNPEKDHQKNPEKDNITVKNVDDGAWVDLSPKDNTNYDLNTIKGANTRVIIRGKNTPKNDTETNTPS